MTGSAASSAVLCAASRSDRSAMRCWLALFLAERTARPAPASAATSSRTRAPARVRRPHRPRVLARPLARRNSASAAVSAGYRPGSAAQTRVASRAAASWTPRYSRDESLPSAPPRGVLGELTVEDQAGLVLLQPVTQPRPCLQQHVVGDLRRIGASTTSRLRASASSTARLGPLVLRLARAQLGRDTGGGRPAVMAHGGHPPEHVPRDPAGPPSVRRRPPRR